MKQKTIQLPEIKLVGISVRTNNESEMNPKTAKIAIMIERFFNKKIQEKIKNRKNPGRIFSVYTNYETDVNGDYTYFVGEEVTSLNTIDKELSALTIPAETYAEFVSNPGMMPNILINIWKKIWVMTPEELGGQRTYVADFEIFHEKDFDNLNATVEVYISIDTKK